MAIGVNISQYDNFGLTPMHIAVIQNQTDVIKYFLNSENVINKNPGSKFGNKTPLHYASELGFLEVVKLIIKYLGENNKNPPDDYGITPLHAAAGHKNEMQIGKSIF